MLTEGVIRKQYLRFFYVGHHIVRPMDHRHFNERKRIAPGTKRIMAFYFLIAMILEILLHHAGNTGIGTICFGIRIMTLYF